MIGMMLYQWASGVPEIKIEVELTPDLLEEIQEGNPSNVLSCLEQGSCIWENGGFAYQAVDAEDRFKRTCQSLLP